MKTIIACIISTLIISGCVHKPKQLLTTGYYSDGTPFAWCENPRLFDRAFIDYVNKSHLNSKNYKVERIEDIKENDSRPNAAVLVPLKCNGTFSMSNGSYYKFKVVVSIPKVDTPTINSLVIERDLAKEQAEHEMFTQSFNLPAIQYCEDLMSKVRETYGRAPHCVPVILKGSNHTKKHGVVGLSDDSSAKGIYHYLTILPAQFNGEYLYNAREINTLISVMKFKGKGV